MSVAYVVSRYPAISHTFIRREVDELRRRGAKIETFSVRRALPADLVSIADRDAASTTHAILPVSPLGLLRDHAAALARSPHGYLGTLAEALRHRLPGARAALWALFYFAEAVVAAEEMRRRGVHHVHSHFSNSGGTVGMLAARLLGLTWSLTLHGSADFDTPSRALIGRKIAAARFAVCVSDFGRAQTLRFAAPADWPKVKVSRCGLDLAKLPARRDEPRGDECLQVLCVGRLSPEKGHLGLLEAFGMLLRSGVEAELHLVGDGPERGRLETVRRESGWADRCILHGSVPEDRVLELVGRADIFVLSSLSEGLPVALTEAMAAGTPVVAPRIAGIPEIVADGREGRLYTVGRWDELAQALAELAADPVLRRRMGEDARHQVARLHDIETAIAPLWEELGRVR